MEYQLPPQQPQVANTPVAPVSGHPVAVGVMQGTLTHVQAGLQGPNGNADTQEAHRWTQYQQLWRQHVYMNGNLGFLFHFVLVTVNLISKYKFTLKCSIFFCFYMLLNGLNWNWLNFLEIDQNEIANNKTTLMLHLRQGRTKDLN